MTTTDARKRRDERVKAQASAERDELREAIARTIAEASGEVVMYGENAHPDHNRWSWIGLGDGSGHPEAFKDHYRVQADALIAGPLAGLLAEKDALKANVEYWVKQWRLAEAERDEAVTELTEAIRLTVEYLGNDHLPPIVGWSWFDALTKYAPEVAANFARNPQHFRTERDEANRKLAAIREFADEWGTEDAGVAHVMACKDYGCKDCVVIACADDLRRILDATDGEGESDVSVTDHDPDYMCPNCCTPWKCNGPHIPEGESND